MNLTDKHVLITGAAKRVGRRIAERLLKDRICLTVHYRNSRAEADELVEFARQSGSQAEAVQADLARVEAIDLLVTEAERRFGAVACLVNSASDFFPTPSLQVTETDWDRLLNLNLKAQFFLSQSSARNMRQQGGVILNIADVHGARPLRNYTPYVVSKAGLLMMSRNLAKELAPKIRVNSISPGPVLLPPHYDAEKARRSAESTLLKRLGSPEDIAEAAAFLIANDYMTGMDLAVDGGRSIV